MRRRLKKGMVEGEGMVDLLANMLNFESRRDSVGIG